MNFDAAAPSPALSDLPRSTTRSATPLPDWQAWLRSASRPCGGGGAPFRVADLFSGCGGLSLGTWEACRRANRRFESTLAWDSDENALAVYQDNFSPPSGLALSLPIEDVLGSAPTEEGRRVRARIEALAGTIDLVVAGPPCQGHSNLNNHSRRKDGRNSLYQLVAEFAAIVKPKWVLIENVPTVVLDKGKTVDHTRRKLTEEQGYLVDDGTVRLDWLGVPQVRRRHLLTAARSRLLPVADLSVGSRGIAPSLMWAIGDLEDREATSVLDYRSRLSPENAERVAYFFEPGREGEYDLPNERRPPCHRDKEHSYSSMYGRMRPDEPAQTLTTGFLCPGQGRYIHPTRPRTITPHEAARVQFFPDWFDFSRIQHPTHLAKMIGNAVPMMLSYTAVERMLRE